MDMIGNVTEWVCDWYGSDHYCAGPAANTYAPWLYCGPGSAPYADPWSNPTGPAVGMYRALRGGSWGSDGASPGATSRYWYYPTSGPDFIGFRCARSE